MAEITPYNMHLPPPPGVPAYDSQYNRPGSNLEYPIPWGRVYTLGRVMCLHLGQHLYVNPHLIPYVYYQVSHCTVEYDRVDVFAMNIMLENKSHITGIYYKDYLRGYCNMVQLMMAWTKKPVRAVIDYRTYDTFIATMTDGIWEADGKKIFVGDFATKLDKMLEQAREKRDAISELDEDGDPRPESEVAQEIKEAEILIECLDIARCLPVAKNPGR